MKLSLLQYVHSFLATLWLNNEGICHSLLVLNVDSTDFECVLYSQSQFIAIIILTGSYIFVTISDIWSNSHTISFHRLTRVEGGTPRKEDSRTFREKEKAGGRGRSQRRKKS